MHNIIGIIVVWRKNIKPKIKCVNCAIGINLFDHESLNKFKISKQFVLNTKILKLKFKKKFVYNITKNNLIVFYIIRGMIKMSAFIF